MDYERLYQEFVGLTEDSQAAATLCLAVSIERLGRNVTGLEKDRLEHVICMGLRSGLFGTGAPDRSGIDRPLARIADAIEAHTEATAEPAAR